MNITNKLFIGLLSVLLTVQLPPEGFVFVLLPIFVWDYVREYGQDKETREGAGKMKKIFNSLFHISGIVFFVLTSAALITLFLKWRWLFGM